MSPKERLDSWLERAVRFADRHGGPNRLLPIAGVVAGVILFLMLLVVDRTRSTEKGGGDASETLPPILSARPSEALRAAVIGEPVGFESSLVRNIRERGWISVTLHVALYEDGRRGRKLGDGASPDGNMYWGALFGVDNFLVNEAGWSRVFGDVGDGANVIRRSVFRRTVEPGEDWAARGVDSRFEIYILAEAWPHARIRDAMTQPVRDALCGDVTSIEIAGKAIEFGAASQLVGYLGQNEMLTDYWNPYDLVQDCPIPLHQAGVFYIAPRSGILLHRPTLDHGLYPVLFAREIITPEAYVFSGMMEAVISGKLGDAFLEDAADSYARYQKSVSRAQARIVLVR